MMEIVKPRIKEGECSLMIIHTTRYDLIEGDYYPACTWWEDSAKELAGLYPPEFGVYCKQIPNLTDLWEEPHLSIYVLHDNKGNEYGYTMSERDAKDILAESGENGYGYYLAYFWLPDDKVYYKGESEEAQEERARSYKIGLKKFVEAMVEQEQVNVLFDFCKPKMSNTLYLITNRDMSKIYAFVYSEYEASEVCEADKTDALRYCEIESVDKCYKYNIYEFRQIDVVYKVGPEQTIGVIVGYIPNHGEAVEYMQNYLETDVDDDMNDLAMSLETIYHIDDLLEDEDTHSAVIGGNIDG